MTGNAMWQVQKGREPLGLRRAVLFDIFPTVSTTNYRAHRNDEHIHQLVTAVGGIGASGIGQRGKIVLKRGRWEHTHKGPPLGTKGFWLQITRPPYRKTHSSFKCACPGGHSAIPGEVGVPIVPDDVGHFQERTAHGWGSGGAGSGNSSSGLGMTARA